MCVMDAMVGRHRASSSRERAAMVVYKMSTYLPTYVRVPTTNTRLYLVGTFILRYLPR